MSKWANRSLPVTARLRSRFFINIGGPQGHATPLKNMSRKSRAISASCRTRLGTEPMRFFIELGGPQGLGHSLPVTAQNGRYATSCL
ncbi:MAG: hypothetical protein ABSH09_08260 [Bryobacteraceae bacterium]